MVKKADSLAELLENVPTNAVIGDNLIRAWTKINCPKYKKILCSISGGSDSDIMLDICYRCDKDNKVEYVWFDTGLEYQATKDHLRELEKKYNIDIKIEKAAKSIPTSCKTYGQPFISKNVSEMIDRLQCHNFQWEDKSYEELLEKYCEVITEEEAYCYGKKKKGVAKLFGKYYRGCVNALAWWCNENQSIRFCINYNKWLKEFIITYPPEFRISSKCCKGAKKDVIHRLLAKNNYDMNVSGIRKYEGGIRGTAYKSCFDDNDSGHDNYRPLFWYTNDDKKIYENAYDIVNSKCYTDYKLKRTGCAGCPYGRDFEMELDVIQKYEPKFYIAVNNIFGKSYAYTRKYREFCQLNEEQVAKFVE